MKADPEDLRRLSEDLTAAMKAHEDALQHNPGIAADLLHLRNKVRERYDSVTENRSKQGDVIK